MSDITSHWRKSYANLYLGAWDLFVPSKGTYAEVRARITDVHDRVVVSEGGRKENPLQLCLVGCKTGKSMPDMIVSKGNGTTLQVMFGPVPRDWVGKEITLYVRKAKKVQKGTGDVLTIRSTRALQDMKEELRQARPDVAAEDFDESNESREPGQEG